MDLNIMDFVNLELWDTKRVTVAPLDRARWAVTVVGMHMCTDARVALRGAQTLYGGPGACLWQTSAPYFRDSVPTDLGYWFHEQSA